MKTKKEFKVLSPTAILGYGFPAESFQRGVDLKPDLIAVDAGSVDPGPYYLGAGKSFTDRNGVKRDLRFILKAAIKLNIPALIGSAGGSGARPHVEWCRKIIEEIAQEEKLSFKMGIIYSDIDKNLIIKAISEGRTSPLDGLSQLTKETVEKAERVVAQMGIEPFIKAMSQGCQVILGGRAYDPTVFAAPAIAQGFDRGLAIHMGKILECAAIAATPGSGADAVMGILREDCFILKPLNPKRKFTQDSTAAHSLYEKADPYILPGPGGALNLKNVKFEELEDGMVKVTGSVFEPARYAIKLEGVEPVGYRTVSIAGTRDPIMISKIDSVLENVKKQTEDILRSEKVEGELFFHVYGKNGVMGDLEPEKKISSHEICIVIETLGKTQAIADSVCSLARSTMLHFGYEGRISTAGNLALPFSPSDISAGQVFVFSIYHLMEIDSQEIFKIEIVEI